MEVCVFCFLYRGIGGMGDIGPDIDALVPNRTWNNELVYKN